MKKLGRPVLLTLFLSALISSMYQGCSTQQAGQWEFNFGLVVHGGAGTILKQNMTPDAEKAYMAKLEEALRAGYQILRNNGSSLDAVEKCINILEDSPLFNAGKGAVFTSDGKNELDASIMDGKTLNAGAIAGVTTVKNPISLARIVMEESQHVMMSGSGAETFAANNGLDIVDPQYFYTERRWKQLEKIKHAAKVSSLNGGATYAFESKFGTVGAVALDRAGNLAAGTSTGGMTNKRYGRIGDSPIIGAGTYANNETCAISATGHGEYFIRSVVAHDISSLMSYKGMSLAEATNHVIMEKLGKLGGTGGVIAIDRQGNMAMPFNTEGMYRGYVNSEGEIVVKIYKN